MSKRVGRKASVGLLVLLLTASGAGSGHEASAGPAATPPPTPLWPEPGLVAQLRGTLLQFYRQRDALGQPGQVAAPRWEAEKRSAAKDPDTLWATRFEQTLEDPANPGYAAQDPRRHCHLARSRVDFIDCSGYRLAATFGQTYSGGLSLFAASRGYYANDAMARMASFYGLYHAFLHDHDSDLPTGVPYSAAEARRSQDYHRAMVRAYEAQAREIILRLFRDTRDSADFQVSLTRTAGLLAMNYLPLVSFLEREQAWASNRDRRNAFSLANGIGQRIWWEWVWTQTNGPATAGFVNLGSQATYDGSRPASGILDGTDHFRYSFESGDEDIPSLRPAALDSGPGGVDGYWFDADYPPPGEWWCYGTFGLSPSDALTKCLDMSARGSLSGSRSAPGPFSPYGQYYGNQASAQPCNERAYASSSQSCGATNLGSIAEEWLWSFSGARMAFFLIKGLSDTGDPDLPPRALGLPSQAVTVGLSPLLNPYQHLDARVGYAVAGFHGGSGLNDDLEWTWGSNGTVRAIRTLSAGLHDGEAQNGRLSVGEGDLPPGFDPLSRVGSTWDRFSYRDYQEYPGAMENHSAGPSSVYGSTLFGLVLGDKSGDQAQAAGGLATSHFDASHRNTVDEFQNWVWLYQSTFYRCPPPAGQADDPASAACFDHAATRRQPMFRSPQAAGPLARFDYLWRSHGPDGRQLIDVEGHIAAPDPGCSSRPGVPWRQAYARDLAQGAVDPAAGASKLLVDEAGFGAHNQLIQAAGGLMRLLAARYPVNAADPAFDAERSSVLKPWYDQAWSLVSGILDSYGSTLGYVPDLENSSCLGTNPDPADPSQAMISWQQGTGATTQATAIRRAMWYSIAANWYWWYDADWLAIDPRRW